MSNGKPCLCAGWLFFVLISADFIRYVLCCDGAVWSQLACNVRCCAVAPVCESIKTGPEKY